jgi:2-polyprenyl-3-methyl-5-hydroxy-6-metoxy-1,4-benzoquinol methylase
VSTFQVEQTYHGAAMPDSETATWETSRSEARYAHSQYPLGARREMLERVAQGAEVLDVGCWSGGLGAFLGQERGAVVDGVEPEHQMAARAADHYRAVYQSTIEHAMEELLTERHHSYDSLLFLDVLEHMVDPHAVLAGAHQLLRPGGTVLVSIPNVAHWSLRLELLRGSWRYRDNGLLDRTHLRFFTKTTTLELVREAGWEPTWERVSIGQPPLIKLSESGLRVLELWPTVFGVQFLLELRPASRMGSS